MAVRQKRSLQEPKISRNLKKNKPAKSLKQASDSGLRASGVKSQVATSATTSVAGEIADAASEIADYKMQNASLEKQIALLQEQIAMLQQASDFGHQDSGRSLNINPEAGSLKSESRITPNPLPAPTLVIMSVSSNSILVDWDKVTNATGYIIEVAKDSIFTNSTILNAGATATSLAIDGLNANTTYYIRVMATGSGANGNSGFSNVQSIRTLANGSAGMEDGVVGDLQNWLDELQILFQNVATLVPQLETTDLNSTDRRRLNGSGVRRYGFIEKVFEVSGEFPQFWPPFGEGREEMADYVKEIDVLRNLLIWFRFAARVVQDLLLIAGNEAFRVANAYYTFAREGARQKNPEAAQVFEMLRLFWKRRRRTTGEPTEIEVRRDFNALMRGTKDGTITVSNESDSIIKGEKVLVDETVPAKRRGGVKAILSAESRVPVPPAQ